MISYEVHDKVFYNGKLHQIHKLKDSMDIYVRNMETKTIELAKISDLRPLPQEETEQPDPYDRPLDSYPEKKIARARWRLSVIEPFLGEMRGNKTAMIAAAKVHKVNVSSLYNWMAKFDQYGHVGCLVDSDFKGGTGGTRLEKDVEDQMSQLIQDEYMNSKSVKRTIAAIANRCKDLGLKLPHANTVRRRINQISERERMAKRVGPRAAMQRFEAKVGTTPNANRPLSLVQMDHTELDIMLVDEIERKPFKRPWLTVLIDSFSRMVLGFYISFDEPSSFAVGRAVAHAVLRKENFLKKIGLEDLQWPCWGKMNTLYMDNGKDFRGTMLKESCANYKIALKWRPPRKPEMGGIIERYMGTVAEELKDLPGNTKVSKEMRAKLQPETSASFTLTEFEKFFTYWLIEVYHKRGHAGIGGMAPIDKWNEGLIGTSTQPGIGLPQAIEDENRLKLDLLPQYKRTVQRTGVHLLKFTFFADVLRKWVGSIDQSANGRKKPPRKFVFKMDPRDISSVKFLDPDDNKYYEIPSTLNIKPLIMSIWDYRRSLEEAKKKRKNPDQAAIFAAYKMLRAMEQEAKKKTHHAKKKLERESKMKKEDPLKTESGNNKSTENKTFTLTNKEIAPYEELEFNIWRSLK